MLESIEIVESLNFSHKNEDQYEHITTKENVKLLRNVLKLILLIKKARGLADDTVGYLDNSESLKINDIFENSKSAFNPNLYRFSEFTQYFYTLVRTNIGQFNHLQHQDDLINCLINFNETIFNMFIRVKRVFDRTKDKKMFLHLEQLFHWLIHILIHHEINSLFNAIIEEKFIHKFTNYLAN